MKLAVLRATFLVALIVTALSALFFFSLHANAAPSAGIAAANPNQGGASMRFAGTFTNTDFNVSGDMTITVTINDDDTIEGDVEFSQSSNGGSFCGGGTFEGTKEGDQIELSFTSEGNPACGYDQDLTFTIEATLLNNTIIRGDYLTDTGSKGIVELRRVFDAAVYVPMIMHEE